MDYKAFSTELSEIQTLFAEAEAICKKVESNVDHDMAGVVIPSINQLRYAGQHLITACNSDETTFQAEQLSKVKNHCCRAIYDAAEQYMMLQKRHVW